MKNRPDREVVRQPWRDFVEQRGLKDSKSREAVVDAFLASKDHVDMDTLLASARRQHPGVGSATVYRTLKLLEEAGLAQARHFGGKPAVYEVAVGREHHDHLICEECGAIVEFVSEEIERAQDKVTRQHGFTMRRHVHELYGICTACAKQGDRRKK